jgi:hypothetical protein
MGESLFLLEQGKNNKICLVFLNGGEIAVREAAMKAQRELGFGLLFCKSNSCNVELVVQNKKYVVDPNLVWTSGIFVLPDGTRVSNEGSFELYQTIREQVFWPARNFVERFKTLIAFHDNGESDFLFNRFIGCGQYEKQIKKVFLADGTDGDSFVLTTSKSDFDKLMTYGQVNLGLLEYYFDDGSFPIWAARKRKRYFNIVANALLDPQQAAETQMEMLKTVLSVIK